VNCVAWLNAHADRRQSLDALVSGLLSSDMDTAEQHDRRISALLARYREADAAHGKALNDLILTSAAMHAARSEV